MIGLLFKFNAVKQTFLQCFPQMGAMRLFLWAFITLTFVLKQTDAKLPGFKARITKKGIGYGKHMYYKINVILWGK